MGGTFTSKYTGIPEAGKRVIIFVDSVNKPTGIWEGVLTNVSGSWGANSSGSWYNCTAKIIDKRIPEMDGYEPMVNYNVKSYEEAFPDLVTAIEEQKREIKGLLKRMKSERDVLYGAMKAMVSPEATAKLEELIGLLLKK